MFGFYEWCVNLGWSVAYWTDINENGSYIIMKSADLETVLIYGQQIFFGS